MDPLTKSAKAIEHAKQVNVEATRGLEVAQFRLNQLIKTSLKTLAMARALLVLGSSRNEEASMADDLPKRGKQDGC
jgi:hypothetical protein